MKSVSYKISSPCPSSKVVKKRFKQSTGDSLGIQLDSPFSAVALPGTASAQLHQEFVNEGLNLKLLRA